MSHAPERYVDSASLVGANLVGAKLTSTRLKQLGACEKAVADCVQLKPGDAQQIAAVLIEVTGKVGGHGAMHRGAPAS